jgi:putative addiction module killer protein
MLKILETSTYSDWISTLRDRVARATINLRVRRLSMGNGGDIKPVGEGVSELRINTGPGYRVYLCKRGNEMIVLLAGGDKSSQAKDIKLAIALSRSMKDSNDDNEET